MPIPKKPNGETPTARQVAYAELANACGRNRTAAANDSAARVLEIIAGTGEHSISGQAYDVDAVEWLVELAYYATFNRDMPR